MKPHHHKYKNLGLFVIGFLLAFIFSKNLKTNEILLHLGNFKYFSAFIGGLLFVSTFTLPVGAMILLTLARSFPFILLIFIAGTGAVLGDFLVFKFLKNKISEEINPLYEELEKVVGKNHLKKIVHTKYFAWTLPVLGALIMASPLPDELGISVMGLSNISIKKFILISWVSHSLGIFLIISTLT